MPEPDFDQIARRIFVERAVNVEMIADSLRQVWNARGAADQKTLDEELAAQHDEIWRGVETHWVRKEAIEDLAGRAEAAETKVAELTEQLRQVWNARGAADMEAVESRVNELVAGEIVGALRSLDR